MTSKNSFWASCKENHKRRIWVWIVSALMQLAAYVGILVVYLSRIKMWYENGMYATYEEFKDVLYRASAEALGFNEIYLLVTITLAFIVGIQGFSYLYDRRKVDVYHSVPVDKNRRFAVVYLNGLLIYLVPAVISILLGIVTAAAQSALNGTALAEIAIGFVWNLLFFLTIYHTVILAVMLTGNCIVTLGLTLCFLIYEIILYELITVMQYDYFSTVSTFFVQHRPKLSSIYDYVINIGDLGWYGWNDGIPTLLEKVLPYCGKWLILAVVILAAAWLLYRKRPSEAAEKAVAFTKVEPIIKVFVAIPTAMGIGVIINDASYGSTFLTVVSMIIGVVIACGALEVIFDFDIKSLLKHPASSGVALVGILAIFCIFKFDLLGYDKYVPSENRVDSIALNLGNYESCWQADFSYLNIADFSKEHMYITDVEPVLMLANKAQQQNVDEAYATMENPHWVNVMYRLKTGVNVGRCFWVDYADPANKELLNRIVAGREYKEGTFQILTDRDSFDYVQSINYDNGAANVALPAEDAQALRDAYIKDMENFDFTTGVEERSCGRLSFTLTAHNMTYYDRAVLDVYDGFENTIAFLQSRDAYYPIQLNPEDIESITVTNYHYELADDYGNEAEYNLARGAMATSAYGEAPYGSAVRETFYDLGQFEQIVPVIYPQNMESKWHTGKDFDRNYEIYVTFKKDTTYPYSRDSLGTTYRIYAGQVPDFMEEATAFNAEAE